MEQGTVGGAAWNSRGFLKAQIEKHDRLDLIEAKFLKQNDKNFHYMCGQIQRQAAIRDTIELGSTSASKLGGISCTAVKPILGKLVKPEFLGCIQKGKRESMTSQSSIYKKEAEIFQICIHV